MCPPRTIVAEGLAPSQAGTSPAPTAADSAWDDVGEGLAPSRAAAGPMNQRSAPATSDRLMLPVTSPGASTRLPTTTDLSSRVGRDRCRRNSFATPLSEVVDPLNKPS